MDRTMALRVGAMTDIPHSSKTRTCMAVQAVQACATPKNDAGIPTSRGGEWSAVEVMRVLERLDPFHEEETAA